MAIDWSQVQYIDDNGNSLPTQQRGPSILDGQGAIDWSQVREIKSREQSQSQPQIDWSQVEYMDEDPGFWEAGARSGAAQIVRTPAQLATSVAAGRSAYQQGVQEQTGDAWARRRLTELGEEYQRGQEVGTQPGNGGFLEYITEPFLRKPMSREEYERQVAETIRLGRANVERGQQYEAHRRQTGGNPAAVQEFFDVSNRGMDEYISTGAENMRDFYNPIAQDLAPKFAGTTTASEDILNDPFSARALGRYGEILGGAGASLGTAMLASLAINPAAGAALLSATESSSIYEAAKAKGLSDQEAFKVSAQAGLITFALEKFGLDVIMDASGPLLKRALKGAASEVGTENLQNFSNNVIAKLNYDPQQLVSEGWLESSIGGLVGGPAAMLAGSDDAKAKSGRDIDVLDQQRAVPPREESAREAELLAKIQAGVANTDEKTEWETLTGTQGASLGREHAMAGTVPVGSAPEVVEDMVIVGNDFIPEVEPQQQVATTEGAIPAFEAQPAPQPASPVEPQAPAPAPAPEEIAAQQQAEAQAQQRAQAQQQQQEQDMLTQVVDSITELARVAYDADSGFNGFKKLLKQDPQGVFLNEKGQLDELALMGVLKRAGFENVRGFWDSVTGEYDTASEAAKAAKKAQTEGAGQVDAGAKTAPEAEVDEFGFQGPYTVEVTTQAKADPHAGQGNARYTGGRKVWVTKDSRGETVDIFFKASEANARLEELNGATAQPKTTATEQAPAPTQDEVLRSIEERAEVGKEVLYKKNQGIRSRVNNNGGTDIVKVNLNSGKVLQVVERDVPSRIANDKQALSQRIAMSQAVYAPRTEAETRDLNERVAKLTGGSTEQMNEQDADARKAKIAASAQRVAESKAKTAAQPAAKPEPAKSAAPEQTAPVEPVKLKPAQEKFIQHKVEKAGSKQAAYDIYNEGDNISTYARQYADEFYTEEEVVDDEAVFKRQLDTLKSKLKGNKAAENILASAKRRFNNGDVFDLAEAIDAIEDSQMEKGATKEQAKALADVQIALDEAMGEDSNFSVGKTGKQQKTGQGKNSSAAKELQRNLQQDRGIEKTDEVNEQIEAIREVESPSKEVSAVAKVFKQLFGTNVVFVTGLRPVAGIGIQGIYRSGKNLFVDVTVDGKASPVKIMSHELMHYLKQRNPRLYRFFKGALINEMQVVDYADAIAADYAAKGITKKVNLELATDEMIADFLAENILDGAFLKMLEKAATDSVRKKMFADLIKSIDAFIKKVGDAVKQQITGLNVSKDFVFQEDLEKLRETLADMLVTMAGVESQMGKANAKAETQMSVSLDEPIQGASIEVAPKPKATTEEAWESLPYEKRVEVTKDLGYNVMQSVAKALGIPQENIKTSVVEGGYRGKVNPSMAVKFTNTPYEQMKEFAHAVGYILDQEGTIAFDENDQTNGDQGSFVMATPSVELTTEQKEKLFHEISKAIPEIDGFATKRGAMVFGNFSGMSDEDFEQRVEDFFGSVADINFEIDTKRFRSDWVNSQENPYAGNEGDQKQQENVFRRAGNLDAHKESFAQQFQQRLRSEGAYGGEVSYSLSAPRASESELPTRQPTVKKPLETPQGHTALIGLKAILAAGEKHVASIAETLKSYPHFRATNVSDEAVLRQFIKRAKDNLLWLYEKFPEDKRERAAKWYDGANRIANELADEYGVSPEQVAGIIAVLSPQTEWFANADRARRVLDILSKSPQELVWTPEMEKVAKRVYRDAIHSQGEKKGQPNEGLRQAYGEITERDYSDLSEPRLRAAWLRIYDQTTDRTFPLITPEGNRIGKVKTKYGSDALLSWGSFGEIAKAISILENGALGNISQKLGGQHKVRSFYNNIIDPNSRNGHVTVDTHAVAAATLLPLSTESTEVKHAFGVGASKTGVTGAQGTYGIYAEAYRQAAEEVGILPREMQSITWEAARHLFDAGWKSQSTNVKAARQIANKVGKGQLSYDKGREQIYELAGGIGDIAWDRPDSGRDVQDEQGDNEGRVPEAGGAVGAAAGRGGVNTSGAASEGLRALDDNGFGDPDVASNFSIGLPNVVDGVVKLVHYSRQRGLTALDPSKHGTGIAGHESKRKKADPNNWVDRTYFGFAEGDAAYVKEPTLGSEQYVAEVAIDSLYDYASDPDGLRAKAMDFGQFSPTMYEKLIADAGYDGFWVNNQQLGGVVAKFTPTDVSESSPQTFEATDDAGNSYSVSIMFGGKPIEEVTKEEAEMGLLYADKGTRPYNNTPTPDGFRAEDVKFKAVKAEDMPYDTRSGSFGLTVEWQGQTIGDIFLMALKDRFGNRWAYVDTAYLDDGFIGQGVGKRLYAKAMEIAKIRGMAGLASDPEMRSPHSNALWDKIGKGETYGSEYAGQYWDTYYSLGASLRDVRPIGKMVGASKVGDHANIVTLNSELSTFEDIKRWLRANSDVGIVTIEQIKPYRKGETPIILHRETLPSIEVTSNPSFWPLFQKGKRLHKDTRGYRGGNSDNFYSVGYEDISAADMQRKDRTFGQTGKASLTDKFNSIRNNIGERMVQGFIDQYRPIKRISEKAWKLARMSKSAQGMLTASFLGGQLYMRDGWPALDTSKKGLADILAPLGPEAQRFLEWVAAHRAKKLRTEGRENLMTDADIIAFTSRWASGTMPDGRSRRIVYNQVLKDFNEFKKSILDIARDSGLLDAAETAHWDNDFYVPFYRILQQENMDKTVKGMSSPVSLVKQQGYKKLIGGEQQLGDLLQNTLMNFNHLLEASLRNKAGVATLEAAEALNNGTVVRVPQETDSSVRVMVGGKQVFYEVNNDDTLLTAISSMNHLEKAGALLKLGRKAKTVFTTTVTVSPEFILANLLRDSIQTVAVSKGSRNLIKNVLNGAERMMDEDYRNTLMASGGSMQFTHNYTEDPEGAYRELVRRSPVPVAANFSGNPTAAFKKATANAFDATVGRYMRLGNRAENVNRAAVFDRVLKDTNDYFEAAFQAADILDFRQSGSFKLARIAIQVIPFLNARLQGLDKLTRSGLTEEGQRMRFWATTMTYMIIAAGLYMLNKDDEEWQKQEDWAKDNYLWFKLGGDNGVYLTLPVPFEVGAMGTMAWRLLEQVVDKESNIETLEDSFIKMITETFSFSPWPQAIAPLVEVLYANESSFTGRPIESPSRRQTELKQNIYGGNTSAVAKHLSLATMALNRKRGEALASPNQIDHLIKGYFGWLGGFALEVSNGVIPPPTDSGEAPDKPWYRYPILKRFFKDVSDPRSHKTLTEMYKSFEFAGKQYNEYVNLRKLGDHAEAAAFKAENEGDVKAGKAYQTLVSAIAPINARLRQVREDRGLSGKEKFELETELIVRRNKKVEKIVQEHPILR